LAGQFADSHSIEGYGKHEAKIFHLGLGNPARIAPSGFFQICLFQKVNPKVTS
jgi:hypothetical protein